MNVIITLAGHSLRFQKAGYTIPKFLIPIDGRTMIEHVIDMFDYTDIFHFVINKQQIINNTNLTDFLKSLSANTTITVIEPHDIGPPYSALQVEGIKSNEKVIISYCDFFVNWNYHFRFFSNSIHIF